MTTGLEAKGLFDHGVKYRFEANGFGGTNTTSSLTDWLNKLQTRNAAHRIEHNFFRSQSTMMLFQLEDGSEVAMQNPGNPYGPRDTLAAARDTRVLERDVNNLSTLFTSDLSLQAQYKFWQVALAELTALEDLPAPQRNLGERIFRKQGDTSTLHAIIAQNSMPLALIDADHKDHTGFAPRTPRTIYIPHVHVTQIDERWLKKADWSIPHLDNEQTLLKAIQESDMGTKFLSQLTSGISERANQEREESKISEATRERLANLPPLTAEKDQLPIGYSITFEEITPQNVLQHVEFISAFMRLHQKAYPKAAEPILEAFRDAAGNLKYDPNQKPDDPRFIGFPACRDYLTFREGASGKKVLTIRFAPAIFSHGGVMEAAGIEMVRDPKFKDPLSKRATRKFRRQWARKVNQLTKDDRTFEVKRIPYKETFRRTNVHFPAPEIK